MGGASCRRRRHSAGKARKSVPRFGKKRKNMLPSHGIGTRASIRFVVPPKFKTGVPVSFGLLLRGGSRGRFRPRSAAVLRLIRTGGFQPCPPLCGSVVRVLLRHLRGDFSTILCDFRTNVKGKAAIKDGNPNHPGPGPAPAFRRWRCCWQRGCCCGRTDGRYSSPHWRGLRSWGR